MMDMFNSSLSVLLHLVVVGFLIVYVPIAFVWRVIIFVFVRPFSLEDMRGKVVLITGASSGIGEQMAYQYSRKGASLVLTARREHALKAVAENARAEGSPDVLAIPADISIELESKRVIEEAIAHFGKLNHLVANAGILASALFEEVTSISAFTQVMASKAAMIRFYETLRAEMGSDVKITILTPGWFSSEPTKGKFLQKGGEMKVDEQVRDVQVGILPISDTEKCAEVIVDAACRGDEYVTWPSWYQLLHIVMCVAPELFNYFSRLLYVNKPGDVSGKTLSTRFLQATGAKKFLYPSSETEKKLAE